VAQISLPLPSHQELGTLFCNIEQSILYCGFSQTRGCSEPVFLVLGGLGPLQLGYYSCFNYLQAIRNGGSTRQQQRGGDK
jgi:hypothetical protein